MSIDQNYFHSYQAIIGCDEVGRGPIAGPVNACAVQITKENFELIKSLQDLGVTDSKKLTQKKRLNILEALGIDLASLKINQKYVSLYAGGEIKFFISEMSPEEIDKINILQAALRCMQNSSEKLMHEHAVVLVDGNKTFETSAKNIEAIVKGDSKSATIGLASIIAKEYRDHLMEKLDLQYPGYGFAKHAGYPTVTHKEAVATLGVTPIHRKTFKGVREHLV